MKKIVAMALGFVLVAGMFSGCRRTDDNVERGTTTEPTTHTTTATTQATMPSITEQAPTTDTNGVNENSGTNGSNGNMGSNGTVGSDGNTGSAGGNTGGSVEGRTGAMSGR